MAAVMMDLILSNSSDASFRGWGKAIGDRLAAFGWARGADTGQIDWATVAAPTTTDQVRGYEMWRMNDALQGQAPVFLKLEYGSGSNNSHGPGLWLTVATGSNGAGTLTGQVGSRVQQTFWGQASATVPYRCVFSGDAGRFAMCLGINRDDVGTFIWLDVERSKDAAGADTAVGVYRCGRGYNIAHAQFLPMSGPIPPNENEIACVPPSTGAGMVGMDVVLYPVFPLNVRVLNPVRGVVGYLKTDLAHDYTVQASLYGLTQTFYVVGHSVYGPLMRNNTAYNGVALRFE
jgi:hypothetical protein